MSFPSYASYQPSGIEWLERIPASWTVASLRNLARAGTDSFTDGDWIESPYIATEGIRLLQTGNVGVGHFREQGFRYICEETFEELNCTEVLPGDILICRLAEPVGRACLAPDLGCRMITSVDVCILKLKPTFDPRFVIYVLSSSPYLGFMEGQCRGGTRDRVSRSFLAGVRLPVPTHAEQNAIADFLDGETAKIDALIAEQQRLMELLQEKRQAVISHAVTKGLNPDAPMKPSGVEWLGDVPASWTIRPVKHLGTLKAGAGFPPEQQGVPDQQLPFYKVNALANADGRGFLAGSEDTVTVEVANALGAFVFPSGSVVFAKVGAALLLGRIRALKEAACIDNNMMGLCVAPDIAEPRFLMYSLQQVRFDMIANPGAVPSLNAGQIGSFLLPVPPLADQRAIIAYLDVETAKIDALLSEQQRALDFLSERRAALITAAVTGQIDVRQVASVEAA